MSDESLDSMGAAQSSTKPAHYTSIRCERAVRRGFVELSTGAGRKLKANPRVNKSANHLPASVYPLISAPRARYNKLALYLAKWNRLFRFCPLTEAEFVAFFQQRFFHR